jgi:hypothetical protein
MKVAAAIETSHGRAITARGITEGAKIVYLVDAVAVVVRERSDRTVSEVRSIIKETSMNLVDAATVVVVDSSRRTVNAEGGAVRWHDS